MSDNNLTKLEEIASRALQGLLSNSHQDVIDLEHELIAESALDFAKLLIEEIKMTMFLVGANTITPIPSHSSLTPQAFIGLTKLLYSLFLRNISAL